jgi:hypothetical protein
MVEVRLTDGAWGRCQRKLPVGGAAKRILEAVDQHQFLIGDG